MGVEGGEVCAWAAPVSRAKPATAQEEQAFHAINPFRDGPWLGGAVALDKRGTRWPADASVVVRGDAIHAPSWRF